MSEKQGRQKTKTPMSEQNPNARIRNFNEVPFGYTEEEALQEASRCLQCKKERPCINGCPVAVDIHGFIGLIREKKFVEAARLIKKTNALPAICGRVCPQEDQCEKTCILSKKMEPVAIGRLERFVADYERENGFVEAPVKAPHNGRKIAIVGSGPAGLTVANDLLLLGYEVTMYEAFHKPGGVLMYGIPEFRLPKKIVEQEVNYLIKLGLELKLNHVIGKSLTVDELLTEKKFDAIFIGVGAGLPTFLGVPGENLGGIYSANEYLTRSNLMKAYRFPEFDTPIVRGKHVCVVGGGNVAMDAARTALRLNAETVTIVYRRSRTELPARKEEIEHAEQEGIVFKMLHNPVAFEGDERGMVKSMRVIQMKLGEPDSSGRRRPIPIEGSESSIETDLVIIATGAGPNPVLTKSTQGLNLNKWGYIIADEFGRTSKERVWAGGDITTGSATVIAAMGAGRKAASDIHAYLNLELSKRVWKRN